MSMLKFIQDQLAAAQSENGKLRQQVAESDREVCLCCKATRWEHSGEQWLYCRHMIALKLGNPKEPQIRSEQARKTAEEIADEYACKRCADAIRRKFIEEKKL